MYVTFNNEAEIKLYMKLKQKSLSRIVIKFNFNN